MAGKGRWAGAAVVLITLSAAVAWFIERPQTTDVPFTYLPFGRVDYSPGAPEGFPDCTPEMVDMRTEDTNRAGPGR